MADNDEMRVRKETAEALVSWLEAFPSRPLQKRLTALLAERRELDKEIRFLQTQLVRYRQYIQDLTQPTDAEEGADRPPAATQPPLPEAGIGPAQREPQYPPRRLAVLRLLRENPAKRWRLSEMREELIRRGWLADDDRARHALQVLMLNMARRGEVLKPSKGIYQASRAPRPQEGPGEEKEEGPEESGP